MNELTNELWTQVCREEMPELDVTCMTPQRQRKFAELVVKECGGIYDKIDNGNDHLGTSNYLEALQKHFGIE